MMLKASAGVNRAWQQWTCICPFSPSTIRTSFNSPYSREREAEELLHIEWNSRMRPNEYAMPPALDEISGAEMIVRALADQGVEVLFGYPGGAVLPIYDAMLDEPRLRHILVRHEQGAAHAAEGYARSSGKPGVALVTSGPGAINTVVGIADALMDSIPLIVITGQVPTHLIGTDALQAPISSVLQDRVQSTAIWSEAVMNSLM